MQKRVLNLGIVFLSSCEICCCGSRALPGNASCDVTAQASAVGGGLGCRIACVLMRTKRVMAADNSGADADMTTVESGIWRKVH